VIPLIESERLLFRAWREADLEPFAAIYACEDDARFIGGVHTRDDAWRRMAAYVGHWALRGYGHWVLEDKSSGAFAGWSGLWSPEGFPGREVAWTLTPERRGRGLAEEAGRRVRAFAYETLGWDSVISLIHIDNAPSIHVAERLGATFESVVRFRGSDCAIYRHPSAHILSPPPALLNQKEKAECP
jgi:RimJ/RimL family protein N-acetyltransferase